jgi:hypothetical protein
VEVLGRLGAAGYVFLIALSARATIVTGFDAPELAPKTPADQTRVAARIANPSIPLSKLAPLLGLASKGEECLYDRDELIERTDRGESLAKEWGCFFVKKSLQEDSSRKCSPHPEKVFLKPYSGRRRTIRGHFSNRLKFYKLPYAYDLLQQGDFTRVEVRVHLKGELSQDIATMALMRTRLIEAEKLWNDEKSVAKVRFSFKFVSPLERPHFEVSLWNWTGQAASMPYFFGISTAHQPSTLAHEFGHMMGLDDEYFAMNNLPGVSKVLGTKNHQASGCLSTSLMCLSGNERASIWDYHRYLVVRRGACY